MQDKLNTSDHIAEFLDNVPKDKNSVTIHNLLTHTAGIISDTGDDYEVVSRNEAIRRALEARLLFHPGEDYAYSNAGYSLLAAIVEIVSEQPYEEFLHDNLFKPTRMAFTGYRLPNWNEKVVADWYVDEVNNGNSLKKAFPHWNIIGNGGILSTTEDMYKWSRALKGDLILSAKAKQKLFTPFLRGYAYGWDIRKTDHGTLISHDGGNNLGATADFRLFVDQDVVIVLFCNQSFGRSSPMFQVREKITKLAFGGKIPMPPATLESIPDGLKKFEGAYALLNGSCFAISSMADALRLEAKGQDAANVVFHSEDEWIPDYSDLNARSMAVCEAVVKGDYVTLRKELEDESTFERKRRFLQDMLNRSELGLVKKVDVIGTHPTWRAKDAVETLVEFGFAKTNIEFGLLWRGGKLWGVTGNPDYSGVTLKPISEMTFAGYHLGLAKNVQFRFCANESGEISRLVSKVKNGEIAADKI
jgi:CubicO group peptidase (beta-lactamase class C family)